MIEALDIFNPNNWHGLLTSHEFRVYGDDRCIDWAIVDEIDYHWAIEWRWHINKPHPTRKGSKQYFRRSMSNGLRYFPPLYLHVEIMKRTGVEPDSPLHILVDHIDGNEWNCKRLNLQWATTSMNAKTRKKRV